MGKRITDIYKTGINSKHPLYSVWYGMRDRCYNKNYKLYHLYGGKGVRVCDEWLNSFNNFYLWAIKSGWKKGLVLDKDIKARATGVEPLLYSPSTCSLVTQKKNLNCRSNNTYITFGGVTRTLKEWSEHLGVAYLTMIRRIKKYSIEDAITKTKYSHPKFKKGNK
jgi:hypothetical protein